MPIINQVVKGGGGSSVSEPYLELQVDSSGVLVGSKTTNRIIDLGGATNVGDGVLAGAYKNNTNISGALDLSSLVNVNGSYACAWAFMGCTALTSVDLSSLEKVYESFAFLRMFEGCTSLSLVDLSSLNEIRGTSSCQQLFYGCTSLTSINLSSLEKFTINGSLQSAFSRTGIKTLKFESLNSLVSARCLSSLCSYSSVENIYFYALTPSSFGTITNQFNSMLQGVTGCSVHFPIAIQSTIGSWSDVTVGFSGTNTIVLYDIVTSLVGADTSTYTRKQKESTSTATAWMDGNDVLFYTSGTSEPTVGATIYSDSDCTTAVTTISSIA